MFETKWSISKLRFQSSNLGVHGLVVPGYIKDVLMLLCNNLIRIKHVSRCVTAYPVEYVLNSGWCWYLVFSLQGCFHPTSLETSINGLYICFFTKLPHLPRDPTIRFLKSMKTIYKYFWLNSQKLSWTISLMLKTTVFLFYPQLPQSFPHFCTKRPSIRHMDPWVVMELRVSIWSNVQIEDICKCLTPQQPTKPCVRRKVVLRKNAWNCGSLRVQKKKDKGSSWENS